MVTAECRSVVVMCSFLNECGECKMGWGVGSVGAGAVLPHVDCALCGITLLAA